MSKERLGVKSDAESEKNKMIRKKKNDASSRIPLLQFF